MTSSAPGAYLTENSPGRRLLIEILHRHRTEIIEQATDWVRGAAIDLGSKRPRDETRALSEAGVAAYEAALLSDDMAPFEAYTGRASALRVTHEFHISTLLRGVVSVRWVLEGFLRAEGGDGWAAFDVLAAMDSAYFTTAFRLADTYTAMLNQTIQRRRSELEEELARVTEQTTRVLNDKIATIEAQHRMLTTLSAPVIQVWEGVLVAPLVGEIRGGRAAQLMESVLGAITTTRARVVLLDLTGLTLVDTGTAQGLLRLMGAARLLGAEGALVGVSASAALAMVGLGVDLGGVRSFGTLHEGLRAVLHDQLG